ncbi:ABC transporter permease [Pseudonocardia sp. WMMC193]|uniref:ABC transporter permease n=1 Tax=Pseudonocardia sp. WMMC193 TaxID=2911965 RepID=UPI001F3CCBDF|nr:ABC transporter permease [Pseudonocardia sp. WMMC193]MCF7553582.1 ABC transporter permease [Pseudonocardia sp. WMMC193]
MGGSTVVVGWPLGVALAVLVALTVAASLLARFDTARQSAVAAVRAIVQLGAVAAVILAVVRSWWSTVLFVSLMVGVATWTSARRMTRARSGLLAGVALLAGTVPVLAVVLATGTVPLTGIAVVPVAGIVVGGAMTATSVAGRRALDQLQARRGEYEAALSLGFLPRDAALLVVRTSSTDALVPPLDQTRTVGLVTLPGAFVGVLLGSGDPVQAGAAQILVLIGLLAAETLAVWVVLELVARGRITRT